MADAIASSIGASCRAGAPNQRALPHNSAFVRDRDEVHRLLMWSAMRRLLLAGCSLLAACSTDPQVDLTEDRAGVVMTPRLGSPDTFIPFTPGVMNYRRHRGSTRNKQTFPLFGVTNKSVNLLLDVQPHDDLPDMKYRVRITLRGANPAGTISIFGSRFERVEDNDGDPDTYTIREEHDADVLEFAADMTVTSTEYFDQLTRIETSGLTMDATLEVEWWDGHEQEIDISVPIENVSTQAQCEHAYRVYFNGKETLPIWDAPTGTCSAGLSTNTPQSGYRGMYFGIDHDHNNRDAYHQFYDVVGHAPPAKTWDQWLASLSVGKSLYEIDSDSFETGIRPIVMELERVADSAIIDSARTLVNLEQSANGRPLLVRLKPTTDVTGSIAQLSRRGLVRLEATHLPTLPYPITPDGTQPRLSESAIARPPRTSPEVMVKLEDLDSADADYWTKKNPDAGAEFAGYVAYKKILAAAKVSHGEFNDAMKVCKAIAQPLPQLLCEAAAHATYCVQSTPEADDFRLRIAGVDTYFDPQRTADALVVGNIANLDLSFANANTTAPGIRSNFRLENIHGWLEAWLDPSRIQIEHVSNIPTCTRGPNPRVVGDYTSGTVDRSGWLTCRNLELDAALGLLAAPLELDLSALVESIITHPPTPPLVTLFGVTEDHSSGTCAKSWLSPLIGTELLAWQTDVASEISADLATSPSIDEAVDRLLSPFELGVIAITAPPFTTPPYTVHPLAGYRMSALVAATPLDSHGLFTSPIDGLYVPYITRMTADTGVGTLEYWLCRTGTDQACNGNPDAHQRMLVGGLDPANQPFDVSLTYSTAHINQALWAQAARADRLGSRTTFASHTLSDTALRDRAAQLGFTRVATALDAVGSRLQIRFYQEAVPYVVATDLDSRLLYVVPNIIVEVFNPAASSNGAVVAKFLYDIIDRDHDLRFSTSGKPALTAAWGDKEVISLTSTFLPQCYGTQGGTAGCDAELRTVLGSLILPVIEPRLLEMIGNAPGLHRFDSGQESVDPRHLHNIRTFVRPQGVTLVGDLCDPDDPICD